MPKYSDSQIARANSISIEDMLRSYGEPLKRDGRDYRWTRYHGVVVCGNKWYDHTREIGGNTISFMREFYGKSFKESMQHLLGENGNEHIQFKTVKEQPQDGEKEKELEIPPRNGNMRRVFAYLIKQRRIDADIISHFAHAKTLYEDSKHHNAVFVGLDEDGNIKHIHKKGTLSVGESFRRNASGSKKEYAFHHKGTSDAVYVFEAPIDMLSFITLYKENWQQHSYIALDGVGGKPLLHFLSQNIEVKTVCLCLDNDGAGMSATAKIASMLEERGYAVNALVPQNKDWNEDLVEMKNENTKVMVLSM